MLFVTSQRVCCMPGLKFVLLVFLFLYCFVPFFFFFYSIANDVNAKCGLLYFLGGNKHSHTIAGKH